MRRVASIVLVSLLCLAASGCGFGSNSGGPPTPITPSPADRLPPAKRYAQARPVAEAYLTALANHQPQIAQASALTAGTYAQEQSLSALTSWFQALPIRTVKLQPSIVKVKDEGSIGIRLRILARFGPAPLTVPIDLGQRVLLLRENSSHVWQVTEDITHRHGVVAKKYGLALFPHVAVLTGKHVSVVYEDVEASDVAHEIEATADQVTPSLAALYGRNEAARHPVIFVVRTVKQGELLSGIKNWRKEIPQGFVYQNFAYIEWPAWNDGDIVERDGMIAHELTHVASWALLGRSPHSLIEGLAMYYEDSYLHRLNLELRLDTIAQLYQKNQFPSLEIWERRVTDWGLRNPAAVDLCYDDGQSFVGAIIQNHGGPAAIGRLAQAFNAFHPKLDYTAAQVEEAFQSALGVSFERVAAEAHAYAAAHG
jgi:hypothetical protein